MLVYRGCADPKPTKLTAGSRPVICSTEINISPQILINLNDDSRFDSLIFTGPDDIC